MADRVPRLHFNECTPTLNPNPRLRLNILLFGTSSFCFNDGMHSSRHGLHNFVQKQEYSFTKMLVQPIKCPCLHSFMVITAVTASHRTLILSSSYHCNLDYKWKLIISWYQNLVSAFICRSCIKHLVLHICHSLLWLHKNLFPLYSYTADQLCHRDALYRNNDTKFVCVDLKWFSRCFNKGFAHDRWRLFWTITSNKSCNVYRQWNNMESCFVCLLCSNALHKVTKRTEEREKQRRKH